MHEVIIKQNQHITLPFIWSGKETVMQHNIVLAENGARITLIGLLLGDKNHEIAIKTSVVHAAPETKSEIIIRGALTDGAKVNFEGLVKIEAGAKGTNAWLAAHLLLLSDQARGRAIPSLEILENDIKAGHAATVGKVNDEELFYLMSRGLTKDKAKNLIVEGFLQDLISRLPKAFAQTAKKELAKYVG